MSRDPTNAGYLAPEQRAFRWRRMWLPVIWLTGLAVVLSVGVALLGPQFGWDARERWLLVMASPLVFPFLLVWRAWAVTTQGANAGVRQRIWWMVLPLVAGVGMFWPAAIMMDGVTGHSLGELGFIASFSLVFLTTFWLQRLERRTSGYRELEAVARGVLAGRPHTDFAPMMKRDGLGAVLSGWSNCRIVAAGIVLMASVQAGQKFARLDDMTVIIFAISAMAIWFVLMILLSVYTAREDRKKPTGDLLRDAADKLREGSNFWVPADGK